VKLLLVETTQYEPTSPLFLDAALARPDTVVSFVDEKPDFARIATSLPHRAAFHLLGGRPPRLSTFERRLFEAAENACPDIILIVKGPYLRQEVLRQLKTRGAILVNFSTDDPFSASSSRYLRPAVPEYDIYATPRTANLEDLRAWGARKTAVVPFGYKPSVHFIERPAPPGDDDCDVLFIGGADRDRVSFFRRVVELWPEVRLDLYGGYWDRDPVLRRFSRGFVVGRQYRTATARAKVVVNLVRRANRDGHVMRSFEVPACGGCMLAERTEDHERFFEDGTEAVFFTTPDELVQHARLLVGDAERRATIARAGHERVVRDGHTYGHRLQTLLDACATL
jgi:hypothetical protein